MDKLFQYCIYFLSINAPVRFEFRQRIWKGNAGVHWATIKDNGKIKEHIIKVSSLQMYNGDNGRDFNSVVAHEFVHAWQAEYKPWKKKSHNKDFVDMAGKLQKFLVNMDVEIGDIYIKEYDKS